MYEGVRRDAQGCGHRTPSELGKSMLHRVIDDGVKQLGPSLMVYRSSGHRAPSWFSRL
ncbi:hypothetical protein MSMEG_4069 [Mycolicibacterium smegmatis MC2 155]|uniref:Uncharacterized protein n=1 Tax=Mycolicibacterium smegmatis (strain ATCC 700084 / mc(2)155) TaxID=246196 RepID=A0QZL6_MYCS2|nr:hypothetical protein MSMEG_4069 [Mycolicibacterium smegmatis MC2 155]